MVFLQTRKYSTRTQYLLSISLIVLTSVICFFSVDYIGYQVVTLILLLVVSFLAMLFEIYPVLLAAFLSALIWNFFFIPPIFTFRINNTENALMFLMYFVIALINAALTIKIKDFERKNRDEQENKKTIKLYNTLLNSLSHELRTPISAILGSVDTLMENKSKLTIENQLELLNEIDIAGIRLNRQVENILNMSRLESGMLKLKLDWCDMNDLVNAVVQKIKPTNNHKIVFFPDENLPLCKIDIGFTEQILYNLLHNATQYTPENSTVDIKVKYMSGNCIITVSDNGTGFPKDKIAHVFDKFYRLPNTKTGGSGLGLSIVKGFTEAHNGTVKLENNKTGGAKFTIEIPTESSYINNLENE